MRGSVRKIPCSSRGSGAMGQSRPALVPGIRFQGFDPPLCRKESELVMWISRKELKQLQERVEKMYERGAASLEEALRKGFVDDITEESTREQLSRILCAHRDLCEALARLSGKLEAMATRWY